jgi:hypothetical protein
MLWFDDNPQVALNAKIEKAVQYYRQKYRREPNLCLIHPSMLGKDRPEVGTITIRPYRPVLPGHLWIGIEDKN